MKNIKSKDPKIYGHSIRNIQIKHMLIHVNPAEHFPYDRSKDCTRYVCISCVYPTPEKSTWKLEEVTCKNCLEQLKTILHRPDYKGRIPVIHNGQLYEEAPTKAWNSFCTECVGENNDYGMCFALCHIDGQCPYHGLMNKMQNGMKDCPRCGGEKEWLKTIPVPNNIVDSMFNPAMINFITLWKCKVCGNVW
jgi:hypothetical protein